MKLKTTKHYYSYYTEKTEQNFWLMLLIFLNCGKIYITIFAILTTLHVQFCWILRWQLSYQCAFFKKLTKTEFLCSISILKMEEHTQHFWHIMLYYFKKSKTVTETQKRVVPCMEKALWPIEHVESGLRSFLVLLTFWPNNCLLGGCRMHWKMFSSTPGLYPLEANSRRQLTYSEYPTQ